MHERKVITRSGARVRGYFWSHKSRKLIPWESILERKALLVMDSNPKIALIQSYQRKTFIEDGGGGFTAYPDFIAYFDDGSSEIVEVKADSALRDADVLRRLSLIATHFSALGRRYRVMAEAEINLQPRLKNLETLETHRRPGLAARLSQDPLVQTLLKLPSSTTTLGFIQSRMGNVARAYELVANGLLLADLDKPLDSSARLQVERRVLS